MGATLPLLGYPRALPFEVEPRYTIWVKSRSITDWQNLETVSGTAIEGYSASELRVPGLTILAHPDARRIGERTALTALMSGNAVSLSRLEPSFSAPGQAQRRPLAVPHLSRQPLKLVAAGVDSFRLLRNRSRTRVVADGVAVDQRFDFSVEDLGRGIVLLLADRVALVLHPLDPAPPMDVPRFGLVGESTGIVAVRQQIARVADLKVPALVRGETGTGKELVATAVHQASPRRSKPFVPVNMGAIPATLAAAELFGAARGAYTGANRRRTGYFARAEQGTLFLDEIGETPPEVQVLLLRTLETGVVQPVGAETSLKVDVRILAATDSHLESEIAAGRFRAPLLHRLSGYEIRLPPLRERRDDIGRLLIHFLRQELEELGEVWRLDEPAAMPKPWLTASVVARLASWSWPGNVRQLRNVARQLVIGNRGEPRLELVPEVEVLLRDSGTPVAPAPPGEVTSPRAGVQDSASGERSVIRTILLTDLVDSTRLAEQLGNRGILGIMRRHDRAARGLLLEYGGREIDKADGFLLLFDRPIDALGYALEYHEILANLSRDLGVDLKARVGIHVGEVTLSQNDPADVARGAKPMEVEGLAKPLAARLMSLADGSQTLLTRSAFDLARQAAEEDHPLRGSQVRWVEQGFYHFHGVTDPVEVFEVGVEGMAPFTVPPNSEKVKRVQAAVPMPSLATRDPDSTLAKSAAAKPPESGPAESSRRKYRSPGEVTDEELLAALRSQAFRLQPTAAILGISRTSLYALIDKSSNIRKARDLTRDEIETCRVRCNDDLNAMAAELEVSRKGLRRRMTQLGLS